MSGVKGDKTALRSLRKRLSGLRDPKARADLSRLLAEESIRLVTDSFRRQVDPYDAPWKPSFRAASTGGETLSDKGILRRSLTYRDVSPRGFTIGSPLKYANIHQWGGVIRAKNARYLRFPIGRVATQVYTKRGKRRKRPKAVMGWVTVEQVTIPRRSFLPEAARGIPPRWRKGWEQTARAFLEKKLSD